MRKKITIFFVATVTIATPLIMAFYVKEFVPEKKQIVISDPVKEVLSLEKIRKNLKKDCEKKIIWFEKENQKTKLSIVYIPGFSATRKEIYPVVETLGKELKANVFLSRFPFHGELPDDYKKITAQGFFDTVAEAHAIGTLLGDEVIFVGTSTGATMVVQLNLWQFKIKGNILISPAFKIEPWVTETLASPLGSIINKFVVDEYYSWEPKNPDVRKYWDTKYHRDSLPELMKAIYYVDAQDFSKVHAPTLMLYTKEDKVISTEAVVKKFNEVGTPHKKLLEIPSPMHVLAGEISSPQTTQIVISEIKNWILDIDTTIYQK